MNQGIYVRMQHVLTVVLVVCSLITYIIPVETLATVGINPQIPYNGTLRDSHGKNITGTYNMVFKIYSNASTSTALWTGTYSSGNGNSVSVNDGVFQVMLGSGTGNALTIDFNDDTYYLGVTVGTDAEMTPRERLGASGYAINADMLDGYHASSFIHAGSLVDLAFGGLGINASGFVNGLFGLNGSTTTDIDTEGELETALNGTNLLSAWEVNTSAKLATLLGDETGTGTAVFNTDSILSGLTTLANYTATNGTTTNATSTNLYTTNLVASNMSLANLTLGTTGGVLVTNNTGLVSASTTIGTSFLDSAVILNSEIDTLAKLEAIQGGVNIIDTTELDTSAKLATLLGDETGTGTAVFNTDSILSGLTTLANYTATNGTTTNATSTNLYTTNLVASNMSLANLTLGTTGGILVSDGGGVVTASSTFTADGILTAHSFVGTVDEMNSFAGPIEVLSGDDSFMAANLVFADAAGVSFGNGNGLLISQDTSAFGYGNSDLVITPQGNAVPNGYVNITTPGELWLTPNNTDNCSSGCEPSLVLATDGSATLKNTTFGTDRYITLNFTDGVRIPSGYLQVGTLSASGTIDIVADNDGNIVPAPSDERLKKNIRTIDNALDTVLQLRGVRYEWKDSDRFGSGTEVGFIAQELQPVLPEVVKDGGEYLSVNTKNIVAVVVEAIKELNTKVTEYFTRTEQLEREVADLRAEVEQLKQQNGHTSTQSSVNPVESVPATTPEPNSVAPSETQITEPVVETP